ncbi:hypothetical protein HNO89_003397 [Sporosarcina luteola]|nr:hypothetical protein [Sporosarcina luteola]
MLLYFTIFSVVVFSAAMSALTGLLVYQACQRFLHLPMIRHIVGVGSIVFLASLLTKLLLFGSWYYYVATIGLAIVIYMGLLTSWKNLR